MKTVALGRRRLGISASKTVPLRIVATVGAVLILALIPQVVPAWTGFLVVVGVFYLVVVGLDVLMGHTGQVSLGQTVFMAVGGYGSALLSLKAGLPIAASTVVAAVGSAVLAVILGSTFLRLRGYYLALATLGLAVIVQGLATALVDLTGGPSGLVGIPNMTIGPLTFGDDTANYYLVLVIALLGAWFARNVVRSQTGRVLAAISSDQSASSMLGIDTAAYKTRAFVLSAVYASVAGSVYGAYFRFISPDMIGVTVAFTVVVMLGLGGARTLLGPLIGVILIQLIPQGGQRVALYEPLIAGIVLILVMTYFRTGLWGGLRAVAAIVRNRWKS
jgi:branched-chain amino acid transport system permease protein